MGPRANFADEARPIFAGTTFELLALEQDRLVASAPCARARVPRALGYSVLPLPRENRRLTMGIPFYRDHFSITSNYRRFIWVSVQAFIFGTTSWVEKTGHLFLLIVQDSISRAHHLIAPTKELPVLRSFQQQDVQPFLARLATKSHVLCTSVLRCASADSDGSNAFHCCTSPRCGTCPTLLGVDTTNFESQYIYICIPCFQQALAPLLTV